MSSYVRRAMQPDEKIIYAAQLHWIIYKTGILTTLLGAAVGYCTVPMVSEILGEDLGSYLDKPAKYIAVALIVLGAVHLLISFIRQVSTELVITDQRVIAKHGWIATTSYELMIGKVEGATIDQSALGRVMGYGTLMVKGTGGGISPIDLIADPTGFHRQLMHAIREQRDPPAVVPRSQTDMVSAP